MNRFYLFITLVLTVSVFNCQSNSEKSAIQLSSEVFKDSLTAAEVQLIDVRTPNEYLSGHIQNAVNADYNSNTFKADIGKLDKEKAVFIYCRSGKRSSHSVAHFRALGFKKVYELEGGILNWQKANFETVTK